MTLTIKVRQDGFKMVGELAKPDGTVIAKWADYIEKPILRRLTLAGIEYLATLGVKGQIVEAKK